MISRFSLRARRRLPLELLFSFVACSGSSGVTPLAKLIGLHVHAPRSVVTVGDSLALSASGVTDHGESTAVQPSWRSSAPATAQVSAAGVVRGVAEGSAWIIASQSTLADSVRVDIIPAEPRLESGFNNEPAGMTLLSDTDLNTLSGAWTYVPNKATASIVTDLTSPTDSQVFQFNYPQGFAGGYAPAALRPPGLPDASGAHNYQEFYLGFYWKADSAWENHSSDVNKVAFGWTDNTSAFGMTWHWWGGTDNRGVTVPPRSVLVFGFGATVGNLYITPNQPKLFSLQQGRWYKIEWYVKLATTATSNDGIVRIWVNDRLMMNYTDLTRSGYLSDVYFDPVWGGTGGTKQHDDFYRLARARISVR